MSSISSSLSSARSSRSSQHEIQGRHQQEERQATAPHSSHLPARDYDQSDQPPRRSLLITSPQHIALHGHNSPDTAATTIPATGPLSSNLSGPPSYQYGTLFPASAQQEAATHPKGNTIGTDSYSKGKVSATIAKLPRPPASAAKDKRVIVPVRVEPKVFFANERTFLSWLNFSIVLGSLALGLLNFGNATSRISGLVFTVIAMVIMVYALVLYQRRAERIRQRDPRPYDDRKGPTFLVIILISAVMLNFYLNFTKDRGKP
ncbi:hypothetical protein EV182_003149 [Spiromyces aspiralis]|uniref:Uncharacterized protein n=1 Tax=Spiromyces aspiralis TaxID=68401 RepID=A0ACC1HQQ4_9FUNG|nr:hypothetical protein EV182_003149 [Spiromyces aspiralis]